MKKHTFSKRIIAVICAFVMAASGFMLPSFVQKTKAQEPTFRELTFSDYKDADGNTIADGFYEAGGDTSAGVSEKVSSLEGTAFNGIIKFTENVAENPQNVGIRIGGPAQWNAWPGITIYYSNGIILHNWTGVSDGQLCYVPETEPETFINKDIVIRLTFQTENTTDVRITFSVNGTEYYNDVITGLAGKLGPGMLIAHLGAGCEIKSYIPEQEPEWTPSEDLKVITPADFGMTVKDVTSFEHGTYEGAVLDGTRFTTKITMPERQGGTYLCLGGVDEEGWTGLGLKVWKSETSQYQIIDNSGHTGYVDYIAAKADETLYGKQVKLDITTEFIDADNDEKEDDVLYGIFFNDELYKTVVFNDHTEYVGKKLMFYTDSPDYPILLEYEKKEIQKPDLKPVTMQQMGIMEGKYNYCNDLVVQGSYTETLVGTTLTQKLTLSEPAGTWFLYAGGPSAWHGIRFVTLEDGSIMFQAADGEFSNTGLLTPEIAGTDLIGEEIELGIELFENGENVMMGVYINGI